MKITEPETTLILNFCFSKFNVGIWTSREGIKQNVLKKINKNHPDKDKRYLYFKPLHLLWDNRENKLPWKPREYNETNIVLIDDPPKKAILNPKYTAVFPYTYNRDDKKDDGPDGDFCKYLDSLAAADSVKKFIEHNEFEQPPI
ncbi:uncharacterized protein [Rutidosis leptorrhynchoides]|uniref:uncharacterized protein n=1 Tax=Rutidosis leptorrhynchoides TaxID=125765 RepID=UPI003A9912E4